MKVLCTKQYERLGNDCMLLDEVSLVQEGWNLVLLHTHQARGNWFDPVNQHHTVALNEDSIAESQNKIDEYLKEQLIYDKLSFNISDYT